MAGGASKAIERAEMRGCECIQVFTTSPRAWKHQTHRDDEVAAFRAGVARLGLSPVVVHASYLLNLATPDLALHRKSIELLNETARWAAALGASTVILHPGQCDDATMAAGLTRTTDCLRAALKSLPEG
ncbi:MAG: TIM barrel protein, partial [bacterium]